MSFPWGRLPYGLALLCLVATACAGPRPAQGDPAATALWLLREGSPVTIERLTLGEPTSTTTLAFDTYGFGYGIASHPEAPGLAVAYTPDPVQDQDPLSYSLLGTTDLAATLTAADPDGCGAPQRAGVWCLYPTYDGTGTGIWFERHGMAPEPSVPWLMHHDLATGQTHPILPWATEPAVGSDGSVVYIGVDESTGDRSLHWRTPDGATTQLLAAGELGDLSAPFLSVDDQTAYVTVLEPEELTGWRSLLGTVFGVAYAHGSHNRLGELWAVPRDGSTPTQLTDFGTILYEGVADPSGQWAFVAARAGVLQVDLRTGGAVVVSTDRSVRDLALPPEAWR